MSECIINHDIYFRVKNFNGCFYCLAPRPAEKKKLWEVLRKTYSEFKCPTSQNEIEEAYMAEAAAAKKHIISELPSVEEINSECNLGAPLIVNRVLDLIKERINNA